MSAAPWSVIVDLDSIPEIAAAAIQPDLEILSSAIRTAAEYVRDVWARAVMGELLPGMAKAINNDDYYESLFTSDALSMSTPLSASIVSLYPGAQRIEDGYASFDMKPGLLSGKSARMGKNGPYAVVPFRMMTPNKGGTGSQKDARAHGATMPAAVYRQVKRTGTYRDPGNARLGQQTGQRSKLPSVVNLQAVARNIAEPMAGGYTWKYGKFHNMKRVVKQYNGATQSTYWTFRAVSAMSDANSWIHPGQAANPIIDAVIDATHETVTSIIMQGAYAAWGL